MGRLIPKDESRISADIVRTQKKILAFGNSYLPNLPFRVCCLGYLPTRPIRSTIRRSIRLDISPTDRLTRWTSSNARM